MEEDPMQEKIEEHEGYEESKYKGPMKIILALFLVFLLVVWIIPQYAIKIDVEPERIPRIEEVTPIFNGNEVGNETFSDIKTDYNRLVIPSNPYVKFTADKIITLSGCNQDKVCYAKAMFYFVRDRFDYVNDPLTFEYIKDPLNSLQTGNGDCDDGSVLLANLLQAIGIKTRFVFVPGHVFVQADMPEARKKYKTEDDWISLDVTCSSCEFGDMNYSYYDKEFRYFP